MTPLMLGPAQKAALQALRELASQHPVDMPSVMKERDTPEGKRKHMDQMNAQSIPIPLNFLVTFSIEHGHPAGTCRHMSMSSGAKNRTPTPEAVWMIAQELGFVGELSSCHLWLEDLQRGDQKAKAVNLVQPINIMQEGQG